MKISFTLFAAMITMLILSVVLAVGLAVDFNKTILIVIALLSMCYNNILILAVYANKT